MKDLQWSNPKGIDTTKPFIYLIQIFSEDGRSYKYVGKARSASRLDEYIRNIKKIFNNKPRGATQGYRAVHFALAKACEFGWKYSIQPIESVAQENLNARERILTIEHKCNLNGAKTWHVDQFSSLTIEQLLRIQ